ELVRGRQGRNGAGERDALEEVLVVADLLRGESAIREAEVRRHTKLLGRPEQRDLLGGRDNGDEVRSRGLHLPRDRSKVCRTRGNSEGARVCRTESRKH